MRPTKPIAILVAEDDPDDRMLIEDAFTESRLSNRLCFVKDGEQLIASAARAGSPIRMLRPIPASSCST
jgi:CheY-like chemotaxis protein